MGDRVALNSDDGPCVHTVYRYPARFPSSVARWAIERFTREGDTVYDPYVGSGTTAVEAVLRGRHAVGCDINPFALWLTRTKLALPDAPTYETIVRAWLVRWADTHGTWHSEWNARWYDPSDYVRLCGLRRAAQCPVSQLTFLRVARAMSALNPRSGKVCRLRHPKPRDLSDVIERQSRWVLARLRDWQPLTPRQQSRLRLVWGDARTVCYPPVERPHLVLTSPPYLNAYDYLAWCRLEIEWLAGYPFYEHARNIVPVRREPESAWDDIARALTRAWNELKTGGHMVVVVGATIVRGERFDTPARVERLISDLGGVVRERHTRPVRSAIGHRRDSKGRFTATPDNATMTTYPDEQIIVAYKTHG